jgi:hypothetical protein
MKVLLENYNRHKAVIFANVLLAAYSNFLVIKSKRTARQLSGRLGRLGIENRLVMSLQNRVRLKICHFCLFKRLAWRR